MVGGRSVHSMRTLAVKDLIFRAQWVTVVSCLTYPVVSRRFVLSPWTLPVKDLIVRAGGVMVVNCLTYPVVKRRLVLSLWTSSVLKRVHKCRQYWQDMVQERATMPNDTVLGCMLDALVCNGEVSEAVAPFQE